MNALDLLVIVIALSAIVGGWQLGLLARAISWVGLAAGLVVAVHLLIEVGKQLQGVDPVNRLLMTVTILLAGGFFGQALGLAIGTRFHGVIPMGPLRSIDQTLGAVAGAVGVLVTLWLVLPSMVDVPGWPARQARNSVIGQAIDRLAPDPPDTLNALGRLVGEGQAPRVFERLRPAPKVGEPPAVVALSPAVQQRVAVSTVKISGVACRRRQEGSGFVVAPGIVVTNAHVVAGESATTVLTHNRRAFPATVVVFDADRDLALLKVPGLRQPSLPVGDGAEGRTGAVFGHPNGQDQLRIAPAIISREIIAVGRDLYNSHSTRRQVYVLATKLQPGDSGGALVDQTGVVVGVAFAIAPDRPTTAYALTTEELRPVLIANRSQQVSTGPCLAA